MITSYIFDWSRTLYDPESNALDVAAKNILLFCFPKPILILGKNPELLQQIKDYKIDNYIYQARVCPHKSEADFLPYISWNDPKETMIIGDRIQSEIGIGMKLGVTTAWIKQGKFKYELPTDTQPTYTFNSLSEFLKDLISGKF